jgi:predicted Fe-Mo cluster-binding NifX family protein
MKITIPTTDDCGLESQVSDHFGRSPFFAVVDTVTGEVHLITNQGQHFGGRQETLRSSLLMRQLTLFSALV